MSEKVRTREDERGGSTYVSPTAISERLDGQVMTPRTERDRGNRKNNAVRRPSRTTPTRGPSQNPHTR